LASHNSKIVWSLGLVPVQVWIAEARRSRDLLAGSTILSWLMARMLRCLGKHGAIVELPAMPSALLDVYQNGLGQILSQERLTYGIPNCASGTIPSTLPTAEKLFRRMEAELAKAWTDLTKETADSARKSAKELWTLVEPSVIAAECPFQVVWCLVPDSAGDLASVDSLYDAAKRSRRIAEHHGFRVPKCTQCGRREAAGGSNLARWRQFRSELEELPEIKLGLRIAAAETLCGVCTLKRFAGYLAPIAFPSTSAIAARDWLYLIESFSDLRGLLEELESSIGQVPGFDSDWADRAPLLFPRSLLAESHRARQLKDAQKTAALEAVEGAQKRLVQGIDATNSRSLQPAIPVAPPNYAAVISFDGDNMARCVRERREDLPKKIVSFQRALAERVDRQSEPGAIDALAGAQPFYLGGDEGVLLAPAGAALELAAELRQLWVETVGSAGGEGATLSVGVSIFDRERPLGPALATAHQALRSAKELPGKNGLGVTVSAASGSRWTAVQSFQGGWNSAREAALAIRSGRLARGWTHDVETFLRTLPEELWKSEPGFVQAVREEIKRLTYRRTVVPSNRSGQEERAEIWRRIGGDDEQPKLMTPEAGRALADQLHVVAFLGRLNSASRSQEVSDVS